MSWAKLDDKLHNNLKAAQAGLEAMGLWVMCLSYCACQLTNGFIHSVIAARYGGERTAHLAARLVEVGLWTVAEEGWQFKDYLDYNPSAETEKKRRAENLERQNRRRGKSVTPSVTRDNHRDNQRDSRVTSTVSHASVTPSVTRESQRPVPVPDPVPNTKTDPPNPHMGNPAQVSDQPTLPDLDPPARPRPAHGLLGTLARAYGDGIREASGTPFVDPTASYDLKELKSACEAHCGAANTMEAQVWLRRSAAEYRRATAHEAKYQSGFSPKAWAKWLQAGKPEGEPPPPKEIKPPYYRPFPGLEPLPRRGVQ